MSGDVSLRARAAAAARRWRSTLTDAERHSLAAVSWRDQPVVLIGVDVDAEQERDEAAWTTQLFEYVNSHEEIGFFLQERHFHICRAHAAARAVLRRGVVPAGFACPRADAACPFAAAAACVPGRQIQLRGC